MTIREIIDIGLFFIRFSCSYLIEQISTNRQAYDITIKAQVGDKLIENDIFGYYNSGCLDNHTLCRPSEIKLLSYK